MIPLNDIPLPPESEPEEQERQGASSCAEFCCLTGAFFRGSQKDGVFFQCHAIFRIEVAANLATEVGARSQAGAQSQEREGFHRLLVQRLWRCGKCRGRDRDRGKASRVRLRSLGSVVALCLHFAHLLQFGAGRGVQTQSKSNIG